jgi:predicted RNase H-like HicB family nuclease
MLTRYVERALERAKYQLLDDGTFAATVPGLRGVIATGQTLETCRRDLAEIVEAWVLVRVAQGLSIPAIDGATVRVRRAS